MDYFKEYDSSDPLSIEKYSQKLIGKSFREIWDEDDARQPMMVRETTSYGVSDVTETKRSKGNLGQIVEEKFFHYACNNDARPDFPEAGVELKVTPYYVFLLTPLSHRMMTFLVLILAAFVHLHLLSL